MGGLGPGIGGLEILVIGLIALIVVGPKDLPVLLRKVGQAIGKARAMANEFRASFDEMARQSELDELRKEVEALRRGQGLVPLGAEAEATFRDISDDLNRPLDATSPAPAPSLTSPEEWPESAPVMAPLEEPETSPTAGSTSETPPAKPKRKAADPGAKAAAKPKPKPKRARPGAAPTTKRRGGKTGASPARKVDL